MGTRIGIVAPARRVFPHEVSFAVEWLQSKGMEPVYDDRLFASDHIFAGSESLRVSVFQEYLDRTDIDALWLARGGYGSIHIIDHLDFSCYIQHPKPIVGFSDGTVFHGMMQRLNIPSIHASMPFFLEHKTPEALQSLYDALTGKPLSYQWSDTNPCCQGETEAMLIGGNLSVLFSMMGSQTFPNTEGKILFIEEVDEYIYHVERMMLGLKRAGVLKPLKALVVGGLSEIHDNRDPFGKTVEEAIFDVVKEYGYPVCFGFPAGHIDDNRALVFGKKTTLKVSETCSLSTY